MPNDFSKFLSLVFVKISLTFSSSVHILLLYITPSISIDDFQRIFDTLLEKLITQKTHLIILGDFNVPSFSKMRSMYETNNGWNPKAESLNNFILTLNLRQYNNIINQYGNILDLAFCEDRLEVYEAPIPFVPPDKHHPPLIITLCISQQKNRPGIDITDSPQHPYKSSRFNLKRGNYTALYQSFLSFENLYDIQNDTTDEIASKINEKFLLACRITFLCSHIQKIFPSIPHGSQVISFRIFR